MQNFHSQQKSIDALPELNVSFGWLNRENRDSCYQNLSNDAKFLNVWNFGNYEIDLKFNNP